MVTIETRLLTFHPKPPPQSQLGAVSFNEAVFCCFLDKFRKEEEFYLLDNFSQKLKQAAANVSSFSDDGDEKKQRVHFNNIEE